MIMLTSAKIIYLVSIITAIICSIVSMAENVYLRNPSIGGSRGQANGAFTIIGFIFLVAAAVVLIVTMFKEATRLLLIIIVAFLAVAILCFIIALAVQSIDPGFLGWLLSSLWLTFLCLLTALIFLFTQE